MKRLTAFAVGLFIVVGLALHPSINAYHTGFAGFVVSVIFLVSAVAGSVGKRAHILVALVFLAFLEPETKITNSLHLIVVSNGLIVGTLSNWFLEKPKVSKASFPILVAIGGMFAMTLVFPVIAGALLWIHIHGALMFVKYGIVAILGFSVTRHDVKLIVIVLVAASSIVAAVAILQAFNFPWFGQWMYEIYFSARNYSSEEVGQLPSNYSRSIGVAGPIGSALLMVMSLGAWFVLIIRSKTTAQMVVASLGINLILLGIFLTGSRLGVLAAGPALTFGLVWWSSLGRPIVQGKFLSISAILVMVFVLVASIFSSSFALTTITSTQRLVSTVPNLLRGTPDDSFRERPEDFSEIQLSYFDFTIDRETGLTSEYLILLKRYGLAGFLLVWQLWLMIVVRATRVANNAPNMNGRSMGIVSMVVSITMVISAIGDGALLDPRRMTVLLVVVGLMPVLSRFQYLAPSRPRSNWKTPVFRYNQQLFSSLVNVYDHRISRFLLIRGRFI